ncbi:MAG: type II 3-dehydroquinate dehydratase [Alphaproteobacteria bacterium]
MSSDPLITIINGPNLNMLGQREPEIYGATTLPQIERMCSRHAAEMGLEIEFKQSNHEGALIDWLHDARENADGIIINAGAYTHTSIAVMDALKLTDLPVIELHLSNTHARESFRHHSYIAPVATGIIQGFGPAGYRLAIDAMAGLLGVFEA